MGGLPVRSGCENRETEHESKSIGKKDLWQVQGHPPQRRSAGDLRQLETQAAPGL